MKLEYIINSNKYILTLHTIYFSNNSKYLFTIPGTIYSRKFLLNINIDEFNDFIRDCLEIGPNKICQNDFESIIIQLFDKYNESSNYKFKIYIYKKIGNLLIFNLIHKYFYYLEDNLHIQFINTLTKDMHLVYHSYVKYLLILYNNLFDMNITTLDIDNNNNNINDFNKLDYLFDYYLN